MLLLFIELGVAISALSIMLFWFVPHLVRQEAARTAHETAQIREFIVDLLQEQQVVTLRQAQLVAHIAHLQEQLEQIAAVKNQPLETNCDQFSSPAFTLLQDFDAQLEILQAQIRHYGEFFGRRPPAQENDSWATLLHLLSLMQSQARKLMAELAEIAPPTPVSLPHERYRH